MRHATSITARFFAPALAFALALALAVGAPAPAFALAPTAPTASTAPTTPALEERLEQLAHDLDAARIDAHIPGMSIAIVKDDEIIWARGFGLADVAAEKPADEHTIYGIGSTTKAFTATLIGMLVDEGRASWDEPVTKRLPYFDLQVRSDDPDAECALRDLLSHRHGFSRMGILAMSREVSREEVLRTAAGAEPWDDFREGFHYCNVTYLAAGQAAGVAAGGSWDEMMAERIFGPLGMTSSTLTVADAQRDPRLALGYTWDETAERFERMKMVDLGVIGPAGAVNSNALDMAQWLRLQLGRGEVDGERLVSEERILDTWAPQIEMAPGASYGLGWMLGEHDGRKVVEHGGNVDGFTAQVSLMPEENLGYVLLTNLNASPFRQASLPTIFDALLEAAPEASPGETPAIAAVEAGEIDLEEYAGVYVANFATFRDAAFTIEIRGDRLALDMAGQQATDLKAPDADGVWFSTLTDQLAVSFDRDARGAVVGLKIHNGGFRFEVPREGVETEPDAPAEELQKYVGVYTRAEGGRQIRIVIVKGRLAIDDRGSLLTFHAPDAEGRAPLRAREDQGATFKFDAEGNVESLVFRGAAGDRLFRRVADAPETELPTVEEVLALRKTDARVAALQANDGAKVSGEVWIAQAGLRGALTVYSRGGDRHATHMDFGKFGRVSEVLRGDEAWAYNPLRGVKARKGDELAQALLGRPGAVDGDWREHFDAVKVIGVDTVNGRRAYVVRLEKGGLPSRTYRIDAENGDLLRVNQTAIEAGFRVAVTTNFFDFEEFEGIRSARRVEIANPASGRTVLTFERYESGLSLGDDVFTIEDPDAAKDAVKNGAEE